MYFEFTSCRKFKELKLLLEISQVKPWVPYSLISSVNAKTEIAISWGRWMGMGLIRLSLAHRIYTSRGFVRIPRGVVMVGAGSGSLVPSQRVERSGDSLEVNLVAAAAAAAFTNIYNKSRGARGSRHRRRAERTKEHLHSGRRGARTFRSLRTCLQKCVRCACVSVTWSPLVLAKSGDWLFVCGYSTLPFRPFGPRERPTDGIAMRLPSTGRRRESYTLTAARR